MGWLPCYFHTCFGSVSYRIVRSCVPTALYRCAVWKKKRTTDPQQIENCPVGSSCGVCRRIADKANVVKRLQEISPPTRANPRHGRVCIIITDLLRRRILCACYYVGLRGRVSDFGVGTRYGRRRHPTETAQECAPPPPPPITRMTESTIGYWKLRLQSTAGGREARLREIERDGARWSERKGEYCVRRFSVSLTDLRGGHDNGGPRAMAVTRE